jgi:molecular chaperone Hsp33
MCGQGRCAITLDPKDRCPASSPTRAWCRCLATKHEKLNKLSEVLEHYMLQSEQLDTRLVLAANDEVAAGLLIQRLPVQGEGQPGRGWIAATNDDIGLNEDYNRIAILAATPDPRRVADAGCGHHPAPAVLGRKGHPLRAAASAPRFACTCSRERVGNMIRGLGVAEAESILAERERDRGGLRFLRPAVPL